MVALSSVREVARREVENRWGSLAQGFYRHLDEAQIRSAYSTRVAGEPSVTFHFEHLPEEEFEDKIYEAILKCLSSNEGVYVLEDQHECFIYFPHLKEERSDEVPDFWPYVFCDGEGRDVLSERGTWAMRSKGWSGAGGDTLSLSFTASGASFLQALAEDPPILLQTRRARASSDAPEVARLASQRDFEWPH